MHKNQGATGHRPRRAAQQLCERPGSLPAGASAGGPQARNGVKLLQALSPAQKLCERRGVLGLPAGAGAGAPRARGQVRPTVSRSAASAARKRASRSSVSSFSSSALRCAMAAQPAAHC